MTSALTALQRQILEEFFRHTRGFVLTEGAALAGFHLGHRKTYDLDLFATGDVLADGDRALEAIARNLGATLKEVQTTPEFLRRRLQLGDEEVVVDLVRDRTSAVLPKVQTGSIVVDSPLEILANKLCALLSRYELRDLVDARALEQAGVRLEEALPVAIQKDASATPAQVAWVLSTWTLGPDARVPGGGTASDLDAYRRDLMQRLTALARPAT